MLKTKKQVLIFLMVSFGIAWGLQIIAAGLYNKGNTVAYQSLLMLMMYVPFLAVLLSGGRLKGMGWKPRLKHRLRFLAAAWFLPAIFAVAGAVLFFVLFPKTFDCTGAYLISVMGENAFAELEAQGLTLPAFLSVTFLASVGYAPVINMLLAVGEEAGWRGYLYPWLKARLGRTKGRLLGGLIWGVWHWPLMFLTGYEYGTKYPGYPVLGPLFFCIFTVSAGIFLDVLYEKTDCIWIPALAHGAMNASTFALCLFNPVYSGYMILGPVPNGLVSGLPLLFTAVWISLRKHKDK